MSAVNSKYTNRAASLNNISKAFSRLRNEAINAAPSKSTAVQKKAQDLFDNINTSKLPEGVKKKLTMTVSDMLNIAQKSKDPKKWTNNLSNFEYALYIQGGSDK